MSEGSGFTVHFDEILEDIKSDDPKLLMQKAEETLRVLSDAAGGGSIEVDVNMWSTIMNMVNFYQTRAVYLRLAQKNKKKK